MKRLAAWASRHGSLRGAAVPPSVRSRHGDALDLWCPYEQDHDSRISAQLLKLEAFDRTPDTAQLQQTLEMLGLRWASMALIQTAWVRHRPEETSCTRCENSRG